MKLLSINVSLPRLVRIHGQQVETGFFKEPVSGPVAVKMLNLDGDGQADLSVHGGPDKAVYVYPVEHLDYWKKKLKRNDIGPRSFGENLTVEGMSENDVAIGDEFAIGTAKFIVTSTAAALLQAGAGNGRPEHRQNVYGFRTLRLLSTGSSGRLHSGRKRHRFPSLSRKRTSDNLRVYGPLSGKTHESGSCGEGSKPGSTAGRLEGIDEEEEKLKNRSREPGVRSQIPKTYSDKPSHLLTRF